MCASRHAEGTCTAFAPQTITFNADAEINISTGSDAKASSCAHDGDVLQLQAETQPLDVHDLVETEPPLSTLDSTLESELTSPGSDLATPASDDVQSTVAGFRQFLLKLSHTNHGTKRKYGPVQLRDQKGSKGSRQALALHQILVKPKAGEMLAMPLQPVHTPRLPAAVTCMRGPQKDHPGKHGTFPESRIRESGGLRIPRRAHAGNSNQHVQEQETALPKGVTTAANMATAKQKRLQIQERSSIASRGQTTGERFAGLQHPRRPTGSTAKPVVMIRPDQRRGQSSADNGTPTAPLHLISLMADEGCAQEGAGRAVQRDKGHSCRGRKMPMGGNGRARGHQLLTPPHGQSAHLGQILSGTGASTSHQMKCRTSSALQIAAAQAGITRTHTRQASAEPILQRGADKTLPGAGCSSRQGCSKSCDPGNRLPCPTNNSVPFRRLAPESQARFTTWSITLASPLEVHHKGVGPTGATISLIDGMPDMCGAA